MKKALIIIVIVFILTSIITFNFTLHASQNFQNFEDDDNENGNDDSVVDLKTSSQNSENNILWNKTYGGDYIYTVISIVRSRFGGFITSGWTNCSGAGDLETL